MMIFDVLLFALAAAIFLRQLMARERGKSLLWALISAYWAVNALSKLLSLISV